MSPRPRTIAVRGGRVVCPRAGNEDGRDLFIRDGRVVARLDAEPELVVDARGLLVLPGAIDLACHLRDPGDVDVEPLAKTMQRALCGGFTTLLALPDTDPVVDRAVVVEDLCARAARLGGPHLLVMGALTVGMEGKELADLGEMRAAGAVAFGDVPRAPSLGVLRRALEYAGSLNAPVFTFGAHPSLEDGGLVAEGAVSTRLGLSGVPVEAETTAVFARAELARLTGTTLFVGLLSSARARELVVDARERGAAIFAGVLPWHLRLDERDHLVRPYDTRLLLDPPLRTSGDRLSLLEGVARRELLVATGHVQRSPVEKEVEMGLAERGAPALDTTLPLLLDPSSQLSPLAVARAVSELPARVLGLDDRGHLSEGARADVVIVDPSGSIVIDDDMGPLARRTSPLAGVTLGARVVTTLVDGSVCFDARAPDAPPLDRR